MSTIASRMHPALDRGAAVAWPSFVPTREQTIAVVRCANASDVFLPLLRWGYSRKVGFRAAICFSALIASPEYTDSAD